MGVNPEGVVPGYLEGASFPAVKSDLVTEAETGGAPQEVLEALPALEQEPYGTADALEEGLRTGAVRAVA